jgi:undecaprenyl-diphosphatase
VDLVRWIDVGILQALNAWAGRHARFDRFVVMLESNSLLKTGLLIGLLWYAWYSTRNQHEVRRKVIRTLLAACIAIVLARAGQRLLPQRIRPAYDPAIEFRVAAEFDRASHAEWSSFPSDHAVLLCAVASGLWTVSRWYGTVAFLWLLLAVFPVRLYLGLHYPSDIVAGGLLGVGVMWLVAHDHVLTPRLVEGAMNFEGRRAAVFYTAAFALTWQVADFFGDCRYLGRFIGLMALGR